MIPRTSRPSGRPRPRHLRRRLLASFSALAFLVAACQTTNVSPPPTTTVSPPPTTRPSTAANPSPAASLNLEATYATIEGQVTDIRGLQAKNPVDPVVLDDAGIRKITSEGFQKDNPKAIVAANERLLKGLGLLPADASLEDLYTEMLGSQVAGLYSPDDKQLYVVSRSGKIGPTQKATFSHEYTHALQDQTFDLSSLKLDEIGEGDRGLARLSLVEGDATLVMSLWEVQHLSRLELLQLIGESLNPEISASLESLPKVLQESLMFPYTAGLTFAQTLQMSGGWPAVNDAFEHPPASTEQVIHPDKYAAGEEPVKVDLPDDLAARMGDGWKVGLEDTLGEFQLRLWLDQAADADGVASSTTASEGWGGDRVTLLDGPNGAWAIALKTTWDTPQDATEFIGTAREVLGGLSDGGSVEATGATDVSVVLASDDNLAQRLGAALGG
jgi:hypothetical protein